MQTQKELQSSSASAAGGYQNWLIRLANLHYLLQVFANIVWQFIGKYLRQWASAHCDCRKDRGQAGFVRCHCTHVGARGLIVQEGIVIGWNHIGKNESHLRRVGKQFAGETTDGCHSLRFQSESLEARSVGSLEADTVPISVKDRQGGKIAAFKGAAFGCNTDAHVCCMWRACAHTFHDEKDHGFCVAPSRSSKV